MMKFFQKTLILAFEVICTRIISRALSNVIYLGKFTQLKHLPTYLKSNFSIMALLRN